MNLVPERFGPLLAAVAVALGVLAAGIPLDRFVRHGVSATWWQADPEGQRVEVARTIEHRTEFPNVHRPLARYRHLWPFDRLPIPAGLPRLDAEISARLLVPEERGLTSLRVRSPNRTTVLVDGAPPPASGVAPGWHRLDVTWEGDFRRATALSLEWGSSTDGTEPIDREYLVPIEGSWTPLRIALWIGLAILALLVGAQVYRIAVAPMPLRRERVGALVTALVLLIGTACRSFDYDVMPEYRENGDELFAIWNGWSILEDGTTRGWSLWWTVYGGVADVERIDEFDLVWHVVTPYFEHPPLLHVLAGAACHLGGADDWRHCRLTHARVVPILLSALTIWLIIAVGRRLDGISPAPWLAGLLFAVIPIIAIQTRVVKEEALLTPLALGAVLFFLRWRDGGRGLRDLVLAAACAGISTFAKVTGFALVPAIVMLVAAERAPREAVIAALAGLATASLILVFGALIDWDAFVITSGHQASRAVHFNIFLRWFDDGLINHNVIGRGWVLFLWLGTMATVFARPARDTAVLTVPVLLYLCAISIGSGNWTFGWYALPIYPFLCLGAGRFLFDAWKRPDLMHGAIFTLVFVLYSLNFTIDPQWARQSEALPFLRRAVSLVVAAFLTPYCLYQVWPTNGFRALARASLAAGLTTFVVLACVFVVRYDTFFETYRNFDREVYFDR